MSEWISVEDRLPDSDMPVLAFRAGLGGMHVLSCVDGHCFEDANLDLVDGVTHWMPLPEPPQ